MTPPASALLAIENRLHAALVRHGITALRITVGAVFLGFGVLKYFPGVSPAQGLATKTIDLMTFGIVPSRVGIVGIATLECFIGICLLANRWMRLTVWLLAAELVGILAPIFLLTGRLFSGPHHAPTLEGQYVLKDIILVAAGMVIAAGTFRGGRLVRDEPQPAAVSRHTPAQELDARHRLEIVFSAIDSSSSIEDVCRRHEIPTADFYAWRDTVLASATLALEEQATHQG
jgi:putative oxidoreductase